jgi:hypothetical protein
MAAYPALSAGTMHVYRVNYVGGPYGSSGDFVALVPKSTRAVGAHSVDDADVTYTIVVV